MCNPSEPQPGETQPDPQNTLLGVVQNNKRFLNSDIIVVILYEINCLFIDRATQKYSFVYFRRRLKKVESETSVKENTIRIYMLCPGMGF